MKQKELLITCVIFTALLFTNCDSNNEQENTDIVEEEVIAYTNQSPFYPIDFEENGFGGDWTWTVFENGSNPSVEIVANPNNSGINKSNAVAKFTATNTGAQWAGFESLHGSDIGSFTFDTTNTIVKMLVYKSVISNVGLKFSEANGEAQPEIKVANTKINEWEELTFDVSSNIGKGITGIIDQIIIFPDYRNRASNQIVYIDRITFENKNNQ
ncbi:glycosyl hydrolase family 16 [Wenyingzhuangia aestuarii]|uniref:glycosyl hydrolase family 16 n=1 Tax=Wenyingzhuangia aestuarii TaxID=1647582 RepID=UPI00143BC45B|nr:glycosyl hydrolase family 16 [Wenyingzhuangia aestuarii]NJB82548.1 hypothetical protein [Wenyingzhuangia aestuarii]